MLSFWNSLGSWGSPQQAPLLASTTPIQDFSSLAIVNRIDRWPYYQKDPAAYRAFMSDYYYFMVEGFPEPLGYVHISTVEAFPWPSFWKIDHENRFLNMSEGSTRIDRTKAMDTTLRQAFEGEDAVIRRTLYNEYLPVRSNSGEYMLDMDLAGVDLFGIVTAGVMLTAYVRTPQGPKYWVQRRSAFKPTFPNMLDTTVGSNLASGERPIDKVVLRALEEASIPEAYTRANIVACGTLTYQMVETNDGRPGSQSHTQYVYEMELAPNVIPKPSSLNNEVQKFELMGLDEVLQSLIAGEFKPNIGLTWVAYLVRHGMVNAENEPALSEICARLHRKLDFFVA
ncbi:hypothetical protein P154DRAFT_527115 [Amniculicola lignicola CBS 123094]|uniref:Nudix hydrolase domain-containing protein n=1 Tax=Amniculicola lignicola CBS 123094 TaxID=1392246 RepID=A0A6A5VXD1_9PLEO|nr:hypothetical protein P154DRAFT_527115 [Amniculicola lignicola CBS 123094]